MPFLETAASSLLGVVVGGAVTYVGQSRLDRRRERRELGAEQRAAEREEQATATTVRMAARLVFLDCFRIVGHLRGTRQTGRWWTALLLSDDAWREHGELMSRELPDADWGKVAAFFAEVAEWNSLTVAARRYYWIYPHLNLKRLKLSDLRDELLAGAPIAMEVLQVLALPNAEQPDELLRWAREAER